MSNAPTIAVLGTGIMGAPIARNLARHGFAVRAWNRTLAKARALADAGIQACDSPAAAVQGAAIVVTLLNDGQAVREAMQAAAPGLARGTIWLQLSTVGIVEIDTLAAQARELGLAFYDAPVLGTRQPAEQGQLLVLASGPAEGRATVQPAFDAIGKRTVWVADHPGPSSRLKLALNHWAFTLTHGTAESLALAKGLGVDPALVLDAIIGGPLDSGYFQSKSAAMLADDYTPNFSVTNALKDSELIVQAARQAGITLDTAQAGAERFRRARDAGHGEKDMAASHLA